MALTGRTALLAALGSLPVGILAPSWTGMLAVNAPLSLAILCDYALAAPVRPLRFTRSGDTSVRLGDAAEVQLTVTNTSRRRLRAQLRDAWPPSSWPAGSEQAASRHTLTVPPGEQRRLTTVLRPTRRGDRGAERITVRSYGPLGLAARQGHHRVPWTVRVLPPFTSRKHLPSRLARLRELDGRTSVLTRGEGTEFDSLRAYVPGDDTRSIDWRATARQSAVAVRTWRPERDRHILIVLDTGRTSAGRVGDVPRLDAAMDATLLLTALATRAGDRVGPPRLRPLRTGPSTGPDHGRRRPGQGRQHPRFPGARTRRDRRPGPQHHSPLRCSPRFADRPSDQPGGRPRRGGASPGPPSTHPAAHSSAGSGVRSADRGDGEEPGHSGRGVQSCRRRPGPGRTAQHGGETPAPRRRRRGRHPGQSRSRALRCLPGP